jgi:DNA polymerase III gamma/tau subunit
MALKRRIDQESFDELDKVLQAEYTKDGDEYVLDAEDDGKSKTTDKERRAFDRQKQINKTLLSELKTATDKLKELESEDDDADKKRKTRDIETLTQAHKDELAEAKATAEARVTKARAKVAEKMIEAVASEMALAISTKPKYILREIRDRLTVEFDDDDEPTLIVKNTKGKNSEMTLDQLKKEFSTNKEYSDIMIASKASGGNAPRKATGENLGNAVGSEANHAVDLSKLSGKALAAHLKEKREAAET